MRGFSAAFAALVFAGALGARPAGAEPGDGVRLGEWTITPQITAEVGYHTNVHYLARTGRDQNPNDWVLRLVPQVRMERQGGRARLVFGVLYDWRKYAYNPELDARDNFEVSAATHVNEGRVLGLTLEDRFRIQSQPSELELLGQYRRTANAARASTLYKPGGALEVRPGLFWDYDRFTSTKQRRVFAERHTQGAAVDARWAFFAHTVLALSGEGGFVRYTQTVDVPGAGLPADEVNSDSSYWKVAGGVVGQVRPKLSIALKAGFGQAQYERGESLDDRRGFLATAKAEWRPRVTNLVNAGYERGFSDVYFTNFHVVDRLFANYRHLLAGTWLVQTATVVEWQTYSRPFARRDLVLRLEPTVKRPVREWADLGLGYRLEQRWSRERAIPTPTSSDAPSDYTTHRFMLTADFRL